MASKLDIWNKALRRIGEKRLSGLDEDTVTGRMLQDTYQSHKEACLEMHSWKFARAQKNLALNSGAPLDGFANSFELPSDCLKIVYFNNTYPNDRQFIPFTVLGETLHTDESTAKITYISSNTPEGQFSAGFVEALTLYMAAAHAYERTQSQPLMERLSAQFERALSRAKRDDSSQDMTYPASYLSYPNIAARFTGVRRPNGTLY